MNQNKPQQISITKEQLDKIRALTEKVHALLSEGECAIVGINGVGPTMFADKGFTEQAMKGKLGPKEAFYMLQMAHMLELQMFAACDKALEEHEIDVESTFTMQPAILWSSIGGCIAVINDLIQQLMMLFKSTGPVPDKKMILTPAEAEVEAEKLK